MTKMLTVRITAEQYERWTAAAGHAGLMLSDWVRRRCDASVWPGIEKPERVEDGQKISTPTVEVERREVRRGGSVVDRILDTTHAVLRKGSTSAVEEMVDSRSTPEPERLADSDEGRVDEVDRQAPRSRTRPFAGSSPARATKKSGVRGRRGGKAAGGKCAQAVGPGIYCASCGERH